jgi:hypothetical protein
MTLTAPLDRVRWSAVLAGLFTALVSIIFLTVLGVAIGLSTVDANNLDNFGLGAGIYGAVAAIIAFALGGYMAARTAAVTGTGNATLNGFMVWVVAIPLIVNLLGAGIGSLLGMATDVATTAATTAAQVAAPVVQEAAEELADNPALQATVAEGVNDAVNPAAQATVAEGTGDGAVNPAAQATVAQGAETIATQAQGAVAEVQEQVESVTPQDVENVARDVSGTAWGVLIALGLTALAAAFGGMVGTRHYPTEVASVKP